MQDHTFFSGRRPFMAPNYRLKYVSSADQQPNNTVSTHIQFRSGHGEVSEWGFASLHELEDLFSIPQPIDAMQLVHLHAVFTLQQGRVTHHHVSREPELHIKTWHGFWNKRQSPNL